MSDDEVTRLMRVAWATPSGEPVGLTQTEYDGLKAYFEDKRIRARTEELARCEEFGIEPHPEPELVGPYTTEDRFMGRRVVIIP